MYAIIETGGKQYRVQQGDIIDVELLGDVTEINFPSVLFFSEGDTTYVGSPHLPNITVKGQILGLTKGPKVIAYKYKARKNSRKKLGHRQKYSRVQITEIVQGGI